MNTTKLGNTEYVIDYLDGTLHQVHQGQTASDVMKEIRENHR